MKIEYINVANMDILEKAYNEGIYNSSDITKDFGKNFPLLLSHITITMIINDLSILETVMLKRFSNSNIVTISSNFDEDAIDGKKFPKTESAVKSIQSLVEYINTIDEIKIKPGELFYPNQVIKKKAIVKFSGQELINIIGGINRGPNCIFVELYNILKFDNTKIKKNEFENLLIRNFMTEFYNFMDNKLQYIDLLTDSSLNSTYFIPVKNDVITMSHVNLAYGSISFLNTSQEEYQKSMDIIKNNINSLPIESRDLYSKELVDSIFFTCTTSLNTFFELFLSLPIGIVLESTDMKVLYNIDDVVGLSYFSNYKYRITNKLESYSEKMKKERLSEYALKYRIEKFGLIPLNRKIQYTLKLKISDISQIVLSLEKRWKGYSTTYCEKEINEIIATIRKSTQAVFNTFSK